MPKSYFFILFLLMTTCAFAQPDSMLKKYRMPIITATQAGTLIKNDFQGAAAVADTNNYPSAQKALTFRKEIDLSPKQIVGLQQIDDALTFKEKEMVKFILANETKLNELFRTRKVNESSLIYYTNRYGLYQGELRNAILNSAVKTYYLLSPQQITKLKKFNNHY